MIRSLFLGLTGAASALHAIPAHAQIASSAQEIVITASRSGIPVWRVDGRGGTLVLVGTINDLAEDTRWDPASLLAAIRQANKVIFPASVQLKGSFFGAMGMAAKARRMSTLPRGQSIANFVSAADYQQLRSLQQRGILQGPIERKHPLQIVHELVSYAKGQRPSKGFFSLSKVRPSNDPDALVRSAIRKHRIPLVPLRQTGLSSAVADIFNAPAQQHAPCLRATMRMANAGPRAFAERSIAWSQRRVADVLRSPAQKAFETCTPATLRPVLTPEVRHTVRALLTQPGTTVAVFDLQLLAASGMLLDELQTAGYTVRGPNWK